MSEAKSAYRPTKAKAFKSPPRRKSEDHYWQKKKPNAPITQTSFGPPMPKSSMPSHADFYSYQSRDMYDSRAHHSSYAKSPRQVYAAPRESTRQPHVKDRLNQGSARSSWRKKEVVKQVYIVKRDGRKDAISDPIPSNQKPAKMMLATKGKEVKRVAFKDPVIESGQVKREVPKAKKELPVHKVKSQPGYPFGLSHWQEWQVKRLRAEELEKLNMASVPKRSSQIKNGAPASVAKPAGVKEDKQEVGRRSRQSSSHYRRPQAARHPYSSTIPSKLAPHNLSLAEISNLFRLFTLWWTGSPGSSR